MQAAPQKTKAQLKNEKRKEKKQDPKDGDAKPAAEPSASGAPPGEASADAPDAPPAAETRRGSHSVRRQVKMFNRRRSFAESVCEQQMEEQLVRAAQRCPVCSSAATYTCLAQAVFVVHA